MVPWKPNAALLNQARAKLNLRLKVVGRRADGYHLLSMLNVPIELHDRIEIEISSGDSIEIKVNFDPSVAHRMTESDRAMFLDPDRNLAGRAARLLMHELGIARAIGISINKSIPLGGGLGGGSSDAACVLNRIIKLLSGESRVIDNSKLQCLATSLGADVPYFLDPVFAKVSGIGDIVEPLGISPILNDQCVLIVPSEGCATSEVYARFRARATPMLLDQLPSIEKIDRLALHKLIENDLEAPATALVSKVGDILKMLRAMPGIVPGLTGSGSCIFVLPRLEPAFSAAERGEIDRIATKFGAGVLDTKIAG